MTLCAVKERVCNISTGSRPTAVRPPGHFCQISALWLPQCILLFSPLQRVRTHPNAVPLACSCFLCWCLSQVHPQGTFPQYQPTSNQPTMLFQISFLTPIVLSVVCRCRGDTKVSFGPPPLLLPLFVLAGGSGTEQRSRTDFQPLPFPYIALTNSVCVASQLKEGRNRQNVARRCELRLRARSETHSLTLTFQEPGIPD